MKREYWLIVTRDTVMVRKRRPNVGPGEWLVRLRLDYPPAPGPLEVDVSLPLEPPLGEFTVEEDRTIEELEPDE